MPLNEAIVAYHDENNKARPNEMLKDNETAPGPPKRAYVSKNVTQIRNGAGRIISSLPASHENGDIGDKKRCFVGFPSPESFETDL